MNHNRGRAIFGSGIGLAGLLAALAGGLALGPRPPAAAQAPLQEAWRLAATWDGNQGQSPPGALLYPAGIDIGGDLVYVVDQANHRVQRYAVAGTVESTWGEAGSGLGQLQDPQDVAVDGNRWYVTDRGNSRVVVYDLAGQPQAAWTAPDLSTPWGVAARNGRVYVTQPETGEVVVFENGAVTGRWRGLSRPRGLAIGADGRVYVADEGTSAVRIFSADGSGTSVGSLATHLPPLDVAVDERGDLYVMAERAVLWYQAGKLDSTQALYRKTLRGVAVSSRHGIFATEARDGQDVREWTFHGVVRWPWRPQNVTPTAEWSLLGYPPGRLNGPTGIARGGDGHLWILDGWPRLQAFNADGQAVRQHAPAGLAVAADVDVDASGQAVLGEARRLVRLKANGALSNTLSLNQGNTFFWLTALDRSAADAPNRRRVSILDSAQLAIRDYAITDVVSLTGSWPLANPGTWRLYWDLAVPSPNTTNRAYLVNRTERQIEVYEGRRLVTTWPVDGIPTRADVAPDGSLFVLTVDGLVRKLTAGGTVVAAWDAAAYSVDRAEVADLAVGPDNRVYTVDRAANVVRVWEPDPSGTPEPPVAQSGACRVRTDKRALPEAIVLGAEVTVQLDLGGDCPVSAGQADILLAIDRSYSMNAGQAITDTRQAAQAFINAIDLTRDRVGVVAFNNGGEVIQPLTDDRAAALAAVGSIQAFGGTSIANALDVATAELFGPRSRTAVQPVIILLTDGRDREPGDALRAGAAAKARGTRMFTIGFGDVDPMVMVLSASTPEDYFYAPDTATLTDIYTTIARRITASVLARSMTITDDLPADMRYVTMVSGPAPAIQGQRLVWTLTDVPFGGLHLAYTVQPTLEGRRPTNVEAVAEFVDGLDRPGRARFPVPYVQVLLSTPTPRPTNTPQPTITPQPTWTNTPTPPPEPVYLPIALAQKCEDRTIQADVAVVLDTSGSMLEQTTAGGPTKLAAAQAAARLFIDRLALPADRATIVAFNIEARVRQPLTGDKTALLAALDDLPTQSGTRIDLGLQTAREELTGANALPGRNRVIVLLTDGQPTMVEPATVISVADEAKGAGLAIYTIGLGADVDAALLRVIASGSRYAYLAPSTADLQRIYSDIAYTIQCVNLDWPPGRPTPGP